MNQSSLDLNLSTKKTRTQELLAQMDRVVPWAALVKPIDPIHREFAQLDVRGRLPDESTILRSRHRLERYKLC